MLQWKLPINLPLGECHFPIHSCVCVCVSADRVQRQEREVMLKLKEVVDRQRDDLRAKVQQITTISREVEAVRT